jgi:hypothetical protein
MDRRSIDIQETTTRLSTQQVLAKTYLFSGSDPVLLAFSRCHTCKVPLRKQNRPSVYDPGRKTRFLRLETAKQLRQNFASGAAEAAGDSAGSLLTKGLHHGIDQSDETGESPIATRRSGRELHSVGTEIRGRIAWKLEAYQACYIRPTHWSAKCPVRTDQSSPRDDHQLTVRRIVKRAARSPYPYPYPSHLRHAPA